MTVHASFGGRDSCGRRSINRSMAEAAIDAVVAGVMFVTELDGLVLSDVLPRKIRGSCKSEHARQSDSAQQNNGEQTESCDEVGAAVKNLGHIRVAPWRRRSRKGAGNLEAPPCCTG